jgi:hypothetical protein
LNLNIDSLRKKDVEILLKLFKKVNFAHVRIWGRNDSSIKELMGFKRFPLQKFSRSEDFD